MKHIGCHSFTIDNIIYIPLPSVDLNDDLPIENLNIEMMQERFDIAAAHDYIDKNFKFDKANYDPIVLYDEPEFLLFHMQDYLPWPGISECLYSGNFKKGTEK